MLLTHKWRSLSDVWLSVSTTKSATVQQVHRLSHLLLFFRSVSLVCAYAVAAAASSSVRRSIHSFRFRQVIAARRHVIGRQIVTWAIRAKRVTPIAWLNEINPDFRWKDASRCHRKITNLERDDAHTSVQSPASATSDWRCGWADRGRGAAMARKRVGGEKLRHARVPQLLRKRVK